MAASVAGLGLRPSSIYACDAAMCWAKRSELSTTRSHEMGSATHAL
jgi:hypothetical protein